MQFRQVERMRRVERATSVALIAVAVALLVLLTWPRPSSGKGRSARPASAASVE